MTKKKSNDSTAAAKPERKTDTVLALLRRDGGARLTEITDLTGWQPHSARAVLTGFRKRGFTLDRSKVDGVTRYALSGEPTS